MTFLHQSSGEVWNPELIDSSCACKDRVYYMHGWRQSGDVDWLYEFTCDRVSCKWLALGCA